MPQHLWIRTRRLHHFLIHNHGNMCFSSHQQALPFHRMGRWAPLARHFVKLLWDDDLAFLQLVPARFTRKNRMPSLSFFQRARDLERLCLPRTQRLRTPRFKASRIKLSLHGNRQTIMEVRHSEWCKLHLTVALVNQNCSLEVPILIEPDSDFQSVDATILNPDSWLEMPLKSDRPLPFRCAVSINSCSWLNSIIQELQITLPTFVTFSRSSSVPYFVVFTTTPRSSTLAKEIAADASISVSLVRQITITEQAPLPPTPPQSPSGSEGSGSDAHRRLLKRVTRSSPRLPRLRRVSDSTVDLQEKPLPSLPTQVAFFESRSLKHDISIGFPKRPRQLCDTTSHPSLDSINALPDGLHKSKISLDKEMLPCIDWAGISVKVCMYSFFLFRLLTRIHQYYLDVAVVIGHDDWRARIPIRIL